MIYCNVVVFKEINSLFEIIPTAVVLIKLPRWFVCVYREVAMTLPRSGFFLTVLFVGQMNMISATQGFCYTKGNCGPSTWGGTCQSGRNQSPIDIPVTLTDLLRANTADLYLSRCYFRRQNFILKNNGHTVQVELEGDQTSSCILTGDLLGANYVFAQMHFHWASEYNGSEHMVNGHKYVMEAHLVHYKAIYSNSSEAMASGDPSAITVLSTIFKLSRYDNPALVPVIRALGSVRNADSQTRESNILLSSFLPLSRRKLISVFQYDGSLTTLPCAETVLWNVFRTPFSISQSQLNSLRNINDKNGESLAENVRPIQFLNDRAIRFFRTSVQ